MRLLITGANGQVGTCLQRRVVGLGWQVLAVDHSELDITERDAVLQVTAQFQPDVIINAAAHTAVDKAESEVAAVYAINRDGPQFLADAASCCNAVLLHISTDYVFAGDKDGVYLETDAVAPQGVYGSSKLAGEQAVAAHCDKHLILRTAWVFGEQGNNFVKTMLRVGDMRDCLSVVADQFGGPTYAGDIADALLSMAQRALQSNFSGWGVYHFSGAPHVSWHGFAEAIFAKAGELQLLAQLPKVNSITTKDYPIPAKRPANSRLDCHKIQQVFGIQPSNWQHALANLSQYLPK